MGAVMRSSKGYEYLDLLRAKSAAGQYDKNFYGIVTEADAPRKTRNDMMCSLWLTDATLAGTGERIELRCFAPDDHQLPRVHKLGDIIRLHRVRVVSYGESVQLIASLGPNKYNFRPPSFCLFNAVPPPGSDPTQPYQKSSKTYHFDDREMTILSVLREFSLSKSWQAAAGPIDVVDKYRQQIRSLLTAEEQRMTFHDLVGLVLAVEAVDPARELPPVVWVWDGTDAPPFPPMHDSRPPADTEGFEKLHRLNRREFPLHLLSADAAASLFPMGTALPVVFDAQAELPSPGTWVKLRNSGFHVVQGQLQGYATARTRWTQWRTDETVISDYSKRINHPGAPSSWAPKESDLWVSETRHRDYPFTPLRQIAIDTLSAAAKREPAMYRCLARVTKTWPTPENIEAACVPAADVGHAAKVEGYTQPGDYIYTVMLRLEDASGSLVVKLFGRAGEEFFALVAEPQDLAAAPEARAAVAGAFEIMLSKGCSDIRGRWLELCIECYWPEDADGPQFRIYESQLKY